jgi:hypothetical protein
MPNCSECDHFQQDLPHPCTFTLFNPAQPVTGNDDATHLPCFLAKANEVLPNLVDGQPEPPCDWDMFPVEGPMK